MVPCATMRALLLLLLAACAQERAPERLQDASQREQHAHTGDLGCSVRLDVAATWREQDGGTCGDRDALLERLKDAGCAPRPSCQFAGERPCDDGTRISWEYHHSDAGTVIDGQEAVSAPSCSSVYRVTQR